MSLIKCKKCGEMFSDSYKTCPFCEEDDAYYGAAPPSAAAERRPPAARHPAFWAPWWCWC